MTRERKSFDVARSEVDGDSLEFELGGEAFAVELPLPGIALLDMANVAEAEGVEAVTAFNQFLTVALGEAEFKRFHDAALRTRLPIERLMEIVQWIVEESTGRPTEQRSGSLRSVSTDMSGSPAAASSVG